MTHQGTNEYFLFFHSRYPHRLEELVYFPLDHDSNTQVILKRKPCNKSKAHNVSLLRYWLQKRYMLSRVIKFLFKWFILGQIYYHFICYSLPGDLANDIHAENVIRPAKRMMNQKLKVGINTIWGYKYILRYIYKSCEIN